MAIKEVEPKHLGEHHGKLEEIPGEAQLDGESAPDDKLQGAVEEILNNENHEKHSFIRSLLDKGHSLHIVSTDKGKIVRFGTLAALGVGAAIGVGIIVVKSVEGVVEYKRKNKEKPQDSYKKYLALKENEQDSNNPH